MPAVPLFSDCPVGSLQDIDKLLILADSTTQQGRRSALVISHALMHIITHGEPSVRFRYLEGRYRKLASQTYLLAAPTRLAPTNTEPRDMLSQKVLKYYLWVCVNGPLEAQRTRGEFGIDSIEENLDRLDETGMLCMIKGAS